MDLLVQLHYIVLCSMFLCGGVRAADNASLIAHTMTSMTQLLLESSMLNNVLQLEQLLPNYLLSDVVSSTKDIAVRKHKVSSSTFESVENPSGLNETVKSLNETVPYRFCGVQDEETNTSLSRRAKRYVLEGSRWQKLEITWALVDESRSTSISQRDIMIHLEGAFKLWSDASNLKFTQVHPQSDDIDIKIGFYTGSHGDDYPFDGRGSVLAHAFYPWRGGDVHFDDSELFMEHRESVKKGRSATSFYVTAAHELGHSLGLRHSNKVTALMAENYQSYPEEFELPDDDVRAIRVLYGTPDEKVQPFTYEPIDPPTTSTTRAPATTRRTTPYRPPITRPSTRRPYVPVTPPSTHITRRPYYPSATSPRTHRPIYPTIPPPSTPRPWFPPVPPSTQQPYSPPVPPSTQQPYYPPVPPSTPRPYYPPVTQSRAPEPHYPLTTQGTAEDTEVTTLHPSFNTDCEPKLNDPNLPDTCSTSFDAVAVFRQYILFFKDRFMWRVRTKKPFSSTTRSSKDYSPISMDRAFPHLAAIDHIDAAYQTADRRSFMVFCGDMYYKTTVSGGQRGQFLEKGTLADLGINASRIDAALIWAHNGHVYVFSGEFYWRLDDDNRVEKDYPRHMGVWRGVPANMTAAVSVGPDTFFFTGRIFWPFDNRKMSIVTPPRLTAAFWLDCPHSNIEERRLCSSASLLPSKPPTAYMLIILMTINIYCLAVI